MTFELPKLEYEYNALEPHIDAKTMEIHHSKHHQAYVDNANKALAGTDFEGKDVNEVLQNLNKLPEDKQAAVRNNAGGHANHTLFWQLMSPDGGGDPSGAVADAINESFENFDKFKEEFTNAGMTRFGSGWAWLVVDGGKVSVMSTPNQDSPVSQDLKPILCLDVWEHSYYILRQNRRPEYIEAWWNVVNWNKVNELFEAAK